MVSERCASASSGRNMPAEAQPGNVTSKVDDRGITLALQPACGMTYTLISYGERCGRCEHGVGLGIAYKFLLERIPSKFSLQLDSDRAHVAGVHHPVVAENVRGRQLSRPDAIEEVSHVVAGDGVRTAVALRPRLAFRRGQMPAAGELVCLRFEPLAVGLGKVLYGLARQVIAIDEDPAVFPSNRTPYVLFSSRTKSCHRWRSGACSRNRRRC